MNNELYKTDIVDRIQFSWKGFKVNGSEMEKIKSTGEGEILTFDAFTFLSPIVKISKEEEEAKEEYFHSFLSQKINYYYIAKYFARAARRYARLPCATFLCDGSVVNPPPP